MAEQGVFAFDDEKTIDEKFAEALEAQPDLYPMFKRIAEELRAAGQRRYSSKAIVEIVRWKRVMEGRDAEGFKVNNIYTSRLSRKLIAEDPTFSDFFETRQLKS